MIPARILLTGGAGFVGGFLRPALAAAFPGAAVIDAAFDVTDRAAVRAQVAAAGADVCVHLAGVSSVGEAAADTARCWAVNLQGTINVAAAILAGAPGCRMIFVSTAEVYGGSFKTGRALDETAALLPQNIYAASKAAAEMALTAMTAQGLKLLRVRPFNHTGPGQSEAFVVPAFAGQIARIEAGVAPPVVHVGALTPARDFLDVRDVCAAYVACIRRFDELPGDAVVNIASGRAMRVGEILAALLALARREISVVEDPTRLRKVEIARAVGDAKQARAVLGWAPQIGFDETLAAVLGAARARLQR